MRVLGRDFGEAIVTHVVRGSAKAREARAKSHAQRNVIVGGNRQAALERAAKAVLEKRGRELRKVSSGEDPHEAGKRARLGNERDIGD